MLTSDKPIANRKALRRPPLPHFRALLTWMVAILAVFKKIKNRGNELRDLLQRQGIAEIASSKRTHFRAQESGHRRGRNRRFEDCRGTACRPLA